MENYLKEMLVTLTEYGVKFVVGGGVACALQGVERVTLDLDIAVEVVPENLNRLVEAVEKLGLRPRVPVESSMLGIRNLSARWLRKRAFGPKLGRFLEATSAPGYLFEPCFIL